MLLNVLSITWNACFGFHITSSTCMLCFVWVHCIFVCNLNPWKSDSATDTIIDNWYNENLKDFNFKILVLCIMSHKIFSKSHYSFKSSVDCLNLLCSTGKSKVCQWFPHWATVTLLWLQTLSLLNVLLFIQGQNKSDKAHQSFVHMVNICIEFPWLNKVLKRAYFPSAISQSQTFKRTCECGWSNKFQIAPLNSIQWKWLLRPHCAVRLHKFPLKACSLHAA